jgi:hypothetical protein
MNVDERNADFLDWVGNGRAIRDYVFDSCDCNSNVVELGAGAE